MTRLYRYGIVMDPALYATFGSPSRVSIAFIFYDCVIAAGNDYAVYTRSNRPRVSIPEAKMTAQFLDGIFDTTLVSEHGRDTYRIQSCVPFYYPYYTRFE